MPEEDATEESSAPGHGKNERGTRSECFLFLTLTDKHTAERVVDLMMYPSQQQHQWQWEQQQENKQAATAAISSADDHAASDHSDQLSNLTNQSALHRKMAILNPKRSNGFFQTVRIESHTPTYPKQLLPHGTSACAQRPSPAPRRTRSKSNPLAAPHLCGDAKVKNKPTKSTIRQQVSQ